MPYTPYDPKRATKSRIMASLEFQAPDRVKLRDYRDPESLKDYMVCPFCKKGLGTYLAYHEEHIREVYRCRDHGDVPPMRSHVINQENAP